MVLADANSHNIVVQQNGVTATYDASYGSGDDIGDPNRVTRSGIHIVMDKEENTLMGNPAYGYTNVPEKRAVRISDNGESIHQNQNTVADQAWSTSATAASTCPPRARRPTSSRRSTATRFRSPGPACRCPRTTAISTTGR